MTMKVIAPLHVKLQTSILRKVLKRLHDPLEVMLLLRSAQNLLLV